MLACLGRNCSRLREALLFFAALKDIGELLLAIAGIYLGLTLFARRRPHWAEPFRQRRLFVLWVLVLAVLLAKVSEDVLTHDSGPVDESLLLWFHDAVPASFTRFFELVTETASAAVLLPCVGIAALAFFVTGRRFQALALTSTMLAAGLLIYVVKSAVGRARPELWETESYWGSSFPSGHTLTSAALATAASLCVARLWPRARRPAFALATVWVSLVALSRLVLGVHWPTDVLAAACSGVLLALAIDRSLSTIWRKRVGPLPSVS